MAETILIVTSSDDDITQGDISFDNLNSDGLTLREAILLTNANDDTDTITFASGIDEEFEFGGLIRLTQGELDITESVTIQGPQGDRQLTITGDALGDDTLFIGTNITNVDVANQLDDNNRVFDITSNVTTARFENLSITGGATFGVIFGMNPPFGISIDPIADDGAGIRSFAQELILENVNVVGNSISAGFGNGAGVYNANNTLIVNSTISNNRSFGTDSDGVGFYGGANGNSTIINSVFYSNSSNGYSTSGGGIAHRTGELTVINSTISNNSTSGQTNDAGGISSSGPINIINSTITGNFLGGLGGTAAGISSSGEITVQNSIILGNVRGGFDVTVAEVAERFSMNNDGDVTFEGLNIVGASVDEFDTTNLVNVINADPMTVFALTQGNEIDDSVLVGVLADNGGPVETIALLVDDSNPALNTGDNSFLSESALGLDFNDDGDLADMITIDARGAVRLVGGTVDIGAIELQPLETNGTSVGEIIEGSGLSDIISGLAGDDTLNGAGSDDVLIGGLGADALNGGFGNDTAAFEGSSGGVIINLILGQGVGGEAEGDTFTSIENLTGSAFDDIFVASEDAVANAFIGGDGDDLFFGFAGNDILNGGDGDDLLLGGLGDDIINGEGGNDILEGNGDNDIIDGGTGDDIIFGQGGSDILNGDAGADVILGGSGADAINGGSEDDVIAGGDGANTLTGGAGDDLILGGDDIDIINGNEGADVVEGNGGDDTILVGDGANIVLAGAGDDLVVGGGDIDTIVGGAGNDTLEGGDSADTLVGGLGNDTLLGGGGNDQLIGQFGANVIFAGDGDDFLEGAELDDVLNGGADNDFITGLDGNDTITGAAGSDTLIGGLGADTFLFSAGIDSENVLDFADDEDMLDLTGFNFASVTAALDVAVETAGGGVFFDFGNDDSVLINNITEAQLMNDILV